MPLGRYNPLMTRVGKKRVPSPATGSGRAKDLVLGLGEISG